MTEYRGLATLRLVGVKQEIDDAEGKRKALGTPGPFAVIQEALHGLEVERKWRWSKSARTRPAKRCGVSATVFEMKAEAARATEVGLLEEKTAVSKTKRAAMKKKALAAKLTIRPLCLPASKRNPPSPSGG